MKQLAVVGSGISAIGAVYALRNNFDITIYEKANRPGGHTHTHLVQEPAGPVNIDTGFIVYNTVTYPLLTEFFEELGVAAQWSDMSFGIHNQFHGIQWAGASPGNLFGQRRNLVRPAFWKMLRDASRFNQTAVKRLQEGAADCTLGEFLHQERYGRMFIENYLLPMGAAVWSTPTDRMLEFPANSLIRFFHNHGFLGMYTNHRWRTVSGGSKTYLDAVLNAVKPAVRLNSQVTSVKRTSSGAAVTADGETREFDAVLIAAHADEALRMLADPTQDEKRLLSCFGYEKNTALLHTDESMLPTIPRCRASWNFVVGQDGLRHTTVYDMNRLQNLKTSRRYMVSINEFRAVKDSDIVKEIDYSHPRFDLQAVQAQKELHLLNMDGRIFFSGSYFRYGFHEDGLWSALQASRRILDVHTSGKLVSV